MNRSLMLVCLILCCYTAIAYAGEKIKCTGTFTSLEYNEEGGDLLGEEVRIVYTINGYEGTFQVSEGGPESLIILRPIIIKGDSVKFTIPEGNYKGTFVGKVTKYSLIGIITSAKGSKTTLNLKRGKSYWD